MNSYNDKIKLIQQALLRHQLEAYIFLTADPHSSEYLADRFQSRAYFSHFHGSAGTFVVTTKETLLWTDSRYYLEAGKISDELGITLMKDGESQTPSIPAYLASILPQKSKVGIDGATTSLKIFEKFSDELRKLAQITLVGDHDIYQEVEPQRPSMPNRTIYPIDEKYTGYSAQDKVKAMAKKLIQNDCDYYLVSALDSVAYMTNLRGADVDFNPFFYGYLLINKNNHATLFCHTPSLTPEAKNYLLTNGIEAHDYIDITNLLLNQSASKIYLSDNHTSYLLHQNISKHHTIITGTDWVQYYKMYKNQTEKEWLIKQFANDGVAYVRFLKRLESGEFRTEYDVVLALEEERAKQDDYRGESFPSIVGSASNGAIIHYRPTIDQHAPLSEGLLVIDSGAHYWGATTDITRTACIGEPSLMAKYDYTMVLKAHIAMASTPFPLGSTGAQIDGVTRAAMWKEGLNFGHGTGHGVGAMLGVHEEPFRVQKLNTIPIEAGMTISNEPGIYRKGIHGVRLENIYISVPANKVSEFDNFLEWLPLTLAPIHTKAIEKTLLTNDEIAWLNLYHAKVYDALSPYLDGNHQQFLAKMTQVI